MQAGTRNTRSRLHRGVYCGTPLRVSCRGSRPRGVWNLRNDGALTMALGNNSNLLLPTLVAFGVAGIDRLGTACGPRPLMPADAGATETFLGMEST